MSKRLYDTTGQRYVYSAKDRRETFIFYTTLIIALVVIGWAVYAAFAPSPFSARVSATSATLPERR
jgi:uncharacterized membrane protein (DUF485 family)